MSRSTDINRAARMRDYVLLVPLGLLPLCAALAGQCAPAAAGPVAAVFPPWWPEPRAFAAAARVGPVLRFGGVPFVVVVDAAERTRLRTQGAWLLLDPTVLGGCGPAISGDKRHDDDP